MNRYRNLAALTLASLLLGSASKAIAQNPGDYVTQWTYDIQTPYAFPGNPPTTNPFCSGPNANCYFTEIDVFAGSTSSTEIDVWTSTTIGPSIISNGFLAHAGNYIDVWVPNPGYWNNLVGAGPFESEPTARSPQTGVLSYTSATENNYYGQAAYHCADNTVYTDYQCFDTWFPTYNGTVNNTNPYFWNGPPEIDPLSQTPSGSPGSSGTIPLTGTHFVNPFRGSGAAGVNPVPCSSTDLSLKTDSYSYNSTTGKDSAVLGDTVPTGADPGSTCFNLDSHVGDSAPVPFDVTGTTATPTFSPAPGSYTGTQDVTVSDETTGATIYYTTDGSTPTTSSSVYKAAIPVTKTTTIKAIAAVSGKDDSAVATGTYTVHVETPTFSPKAGTYVGTQKVTISDATTGATIYYTTNGTTPTTSSTKYTGAISVSKTTTIKTIAAYSGLSNSAVETGVYTIQVATPTFSPAPGTYTAAQKVTLSDATSGATIYYTTNGSTPTTSSTKYTGAITVSATTTIKAIAAVSGLANSAVASGAYTIK